MVVIPGSTERTRTMDPRVPGVLPKLGKFVSEIVMWQSKGDTTSRLDSW